MMPRAIIDFIAKPGYYLGRHRYVFLLSHMRCYTSLLGHILGSNPEVAGFAELHLSYCNWRQLLQMKRRIDKILNGHATHKRVLFDKMLSNRLYLSPEIVKCRNVTVIFSVRRPEETISSIINMGANYHDIGWYTEPESVARYYVARLHLLSEYMEMFSNVCGRDLIFFRAESLINNSTQLLTGLAGELGLRYPLDPNYEIFELTGQPGVGDPSEHIKAGRILEDKGKRKPLMVDPGLLDFANGAYHRCIDMATQHCKAI